MEGQPWEQKESGAKGGTREGHPDGGQKPSPSWKGPGRANLSFLAVQVRKQAQRRVGPAS